MMKVFGGFIIIVCLVTQSIASDCFSNEISNEVEAMRKDRTQCGVDDDALYDSK